MNVRRTYFILIASLLLLALFGCTQANTPAENLAKAKLEIEQKQWPAALIHLKNALSHIQSDAGVAEAEIRYYLGDVYLSLGDMIQAERFLGQAVQAKFDLARSVPAYAKTLFHQDDYTQLAQLITTYSHNVPEIRLELTLYKVLLLHKTAKVIEAKTLLSQISKEGAESVFGLFTRAYTKAQSEPEPAMILINQLLFLDETYADAYLLKGQLHLSQQQFEQAYETFARYLSLQPSAHHLHFLLAISALQIPDYKSMQLHVSTLLRLSANHPLANHLQALMDFNHKDFQQTKVHAEKSIQFGLPSPTNYLLAGVSALSLGLDQQAYEHLLRAANGFNQSEQVLKLLTLVQLKLGYLQDAAHNFDSLALSSELDFSLGNMLATQLLDAQQNRDARAILAKLQFAPVANPLLKLQQGVLQLQAGDTQGLAILEQVVKSDDGDQRSNIIYIMALASSGDLDQALSAAKAWQQQVPSHVDAMNVLALLYQKASDEDNATHWYQQALNVLPDNVPSLLFFAFDAARQHKHKQAKALFVKVLSIAPNHVRAFQGLLQLVLQDAGTPNWAELQALIDWQKKHDNTLQLLASAMYQAGAYDDLHDFLNTKTKQAQWPNTLWRIWLQNQAAKGDDADIEHAIKQFTQRFNDGANNVYIIAFLEQRQKYQGILDFIDSKSKTATTGIEMQYARAFALLSLQRVAEAEFLIASLSQRTPLPALTWLQGKLALLQGDNATANTLFTQHFNAQPTLPGMMQLAQQAQSENDHSRVVSLGKQYLAHYPNDSSARALLANWLMQYNHQAAIEFLDVPQSQLFIKQNWQVANNLAWLYLNSENKQRAIVFSALAYTKQAENKEVAFTHAAALLQHGYNEQAVSVLQGIKQPNAGVLKLLGKLQKQ
jgi:putative PEP-CTERM system TPR-repeat lipoprotein